MRAVTYTKCGPAEVLQLVDDRELPRPGPGEVLVRVRAAGVNPRDAKVRQSNAMRLSFGIKLPTVPGNDIAGEIVELGSGVHDFRVGDRVLAMLGLKQPGGYAEYAAVPSHLLASKPDALSFEQAAAVPLAGLTALQLLRRSGRAEAGKALLLNGASGGVGTFAVQIAAAFGMHVTAVTSTRNVELVRSLGAARVIDYSAEDPTSAGPFDALIDTVGSVSYFRSKKCLKPGGVYVSCDPSASVLLAAALSRFSDRRAYFHVVQPNGADLTEIVALIEQGKVTPQIERVLNLSAAVEAQRHVETNRTRGKVVLKIDEA